MVGILYADKNANRQQDPGEAIFDAEVTLFGGENSSSHYVTSDADGKFVFRGLAPGVYHPAYVLPDGWIVHHTKTTGDLITVTANATTALTARAERPYSEQLKVTATLDHDSYRLPASATITLTLTNTTNRRINGVQARCDRKESPEALGRGPGWNALRANGVTLEAGEQRTMRIVEEIPQAAAYGKGVVTLDCDFAPSASWNTDGPTVREHATVTGSTGGYAMVLGEDRNADSRIDGDEAVKDVQVVLLDPKIGGKVANGTSGADGKIEFNGLEAGEYRAVVLGSWAFTDPGQQQVRITPQGGSEYRFLKYAKPVELHGAVKFDKPRYESHETVRLDLIITNSGGQTAESVRLTGSFDSLEISDEQLGDVRMEGPGVRIPAGESRTFSLSGRIHEFADGKLTVQGAIDHIGRPISDLIEYNGEVEVVQTTGDITGVIYVDRNHNKQQDPGEGAADAVVEGNGGVPYSYLKTTTDAEGRYSFKDVPSGRYWIDYTLADGWMVHSDGAPRQIQVAPGPPAQVTARADRPYYEAIEATLTLDQAVYAIGDDAKITIKLRNKSDYVVSGIQAACNRVADTDQLGEPMSAGWGDLRRETSGVTLNPGEVKTVVATEKVPAGARWTSRVRVYCDFAPNVADEVDFVSGEDWASVPGGFGSLKGRLAHDKNGNHEADPGETLPAARILLMTDREYGAIVADTVSDSAGNVRFDQVPPGAYWAEIDGPWKLTGESDNHVDVSADRVVSRDFFVVPNPRAAPSPDQHDGGGTRGALAKTGASVLGLGVVAVLLVAFGFGARIAGRRRTS